MNLNVIPLMHTILSVERHSSKVELKSSSFLARAVQNISPVTLYDQDHVFEDNFSFKIEADKPN